MISITEKAAKQIKILADKENCVYLMRVKITGGSCSGFKYNLDFINQINENDLIFELDGVKVICDPKSSKIIDGTIIDYNDDIKNLAGIGFVFNNPNAKQVCGCGKTFDYV